MQTSIKEEECQNNMSKHDLIDMIITKKSKKKKKRYIRKKMMILQKKKLMNYSKIIILQHKNEKNIHIYYYT